MNSLKKLLIPIIIFAVLLVGVLIWLIAGGNKTALEEEENLNPIALTADDVKSIRVDKKMGDSVEFFATSKDDYDENEEIETDANGQTVWVMKGNENNELALSQDAIGSYVRLLVNFNASSVVKAEGSSLAEYGLADPDYTINIEDNSGNTYKILIGNQSYDQSLCYFKMADSDLVYTVAVIKRTTCSYDKIDFLSTKVLNIDYRNLASVEVERKEDDLHLIANCKVADTGSPTYTITDPFRVKASPYFENLIQYIAELEIAAFVDIPDSELSDYGLDDPNYHFKFTMKTGEVIDIWLSDLIGEYYYGYCNIIDGYFSLSSMQIKGLNTSELELIDSYVCYNTVSDVSYIKCTYGDKSFDFRINVEKSITEADAEIKLDGRAFNVKNSEGRSYSAMLFETIACIDIGGIDKSATPSYDPEMTLQLKLKDNTVINVGFVKRDNNSYYVFYDEEYSNFYIYSKELFSDGGTDTYGYGLWPAYELCDQAIISSISGIYDIPDDSAEGN